MVFGPPELPEFINHPPKGRVLVIAPHPDDEMMGPGGTLLLHAAQNDPIHIIVVHDGSQGDPEGRFEADKKAYCGRREAESLQVAKTHLGSASIDFLGFPDGVSEADIDQLYPGLEGDFESKKRALINGLAVQFQQRIEAIKPDIIYYPWIGEFHADHWGSAAAFELLRQNLPELFAQTSCLAYEVWATLYPETCVDVTAQFAEKMAAIACYESQLAYTDYRVLIRGLNHYRAILSPDPKVEFVECFLGRYSKGDQA